MKNYDCSKKTIQSLVSLLCLGVMYIRYKLLIIKSEQSENVIQIALSIAARMPKEDIKILEAKPTEIEIPHYQLINNILKEVIRINPKAGFAYIFAQRNATIYFFADSEPVGSKDYSPHEQECLEANGAYKQVFKDGKDSITETVSDRWGKWISVLIPIRDNATGRIIAVYVMDFSISLWNNPLLYELTESSLLLVLLILVLLFLVKIKAKNKSLRYKITQRKVTQESLLISEEKYRLIFENVHDFFFQTDTVEIVPEVGQSIEMFSQYSKDEFIVKCVEMLYFNPEYRLALIDGIFNYGECSP